MKPIELNPDRTILLIIDMQKGFVDADSPFCVAMARSTIPALAATVEEARNAGVTIAWVCRLHAKDGSDLEAFRRQKLEDLDQCDLFHPSGSGFALAQGLYRAPEDLFIPKTRYSAFFQTTLKEELEQRGIETVLVSGTQTPNCVRATAFDAFQCGYRTILFENCTSSANPQVQKANLDDLEKAGIERISDFQDLCWRADK